MSEQDAPMPVEEINHKGLSNARSERAFGFAILYTILFIGGLGAVIVWFNLTWAMPFCIMGPMLGFEIILQNNNEKRPPLWGKIKTPRDKISFVIGFVLFSCITLLPARLEIKNVIITIPVCILGFGAFTGIVYSFGTNQLKESFNQNIIYWGFMFGFAVLPR